MMGCNCHSYNMNIGIKPEIKVVPPAFIGETRMNPDLPICLDACIADTIQHLWKRGELTLNCCCGHNKNLPSIVIDASQDPDRVRQIIKEVDDRDFELFAWKLIKV